MRVWYVWTSISCSTLVHACPQWTPPLAGLAAASRPLAYPLYVVSPLFCALPLWVLTAPPARAQWRASSCHRHRPPRWYGGAWPPWPPRRWGWQGQWARTRRRRRCWRPAPETVQPPSAPTGAGRQGGEGSACISSQASDAAASMQNNSTMPQQTLLHPCSPARPCWRPP